MNLENSFKDCKIYSLGEKSKINWLKGILIHVPVNEQFNFGYILFLPENVKESTTLIVEGSNVGCSTDNIEEANANILKTGLYPSLPIYDIANELGLPILYPLFPRIYNGRETIYNHMLATNSIVNSTPKQKEHGLERVDLQLLSMFEDARKRLKNSGFHIDQKFIIDGFSASAKFANRFTLLHPEYIKMCIAGGVSGILTLPIKELNNQRLLWPVGLGNIEELTGVEFNDDKIEQFKDIPQIYYMGGQDSNNPFVFNENYEPRYSGMINQQELEQIYQIFGNSMSERWVKSQELYKELGVNSSFYTYDGFGHDPRPAKQDILLEIDSLLNNEMKDVKTK